MRGRLVGGYAVLACAIALSSCSLSTGEAPSGTQSTESMALQSVSDQAESESLLASNAFVSDVTVSNVVDEASRTLLRDSLRNAGVPAGDVEAFFSGVDTYLSAVKGSSLVADGFVPLESVDYDLGKMTEAWDHTHPDYVGQNCRITSFQLAGSLVKVSPASPDTRSLFLDKDALGSAPSALLPEQSVPAFEGFFGRVATDASKDQAAHLQRMKEHFASQGVVFPDKLQILSVVMHDLLDDSPFLFIGHVGVLVPAADGEGFLFVEKLAFDEPYQVLRVKDALQASDVLMSRYDIEYGQDNARPFVMANGDLVEGFRGNPNNPEEPSSR